MFSFEGCAGENRSPAPRPGRGERIAQKGSRPGTMEGEQVPRPRGRPRPLLWDRLGGFRQVGVDRILEDTLTVNASATIKHRPRSTARTQQKETTWQQTYRN